MSDSTPHDLKIRFVWLHGSLVSIWEVGEQTVVLSPVQEPQRPARAARRSQAAHPTAQTAQSARITQIAQIAQAEQPTALPWLPSGPYATTA